MFSRTSGPPPTTYLTGDKLPNNILSVGGGGGVSSREKSGSIDYGDEPLSIEAVVFEGPPGYAEPTKINEIVLYRKDILEKLGLDERYAYKRFNYLWPKTGGFNPNNLPLLELPYGEDWDWGYWTPEIGIPFSPQMRPSLRGGQTYFNYNIAPPEIQEEAMRAYMEGFQKEEDKRWAEHLKEQRRLREQSIFQFHKDK